MKALAFSLRSNSLLAAPAELGRLVSRLPLQGVSAPHAQLRLCSAMPCYAVLCCAAILCCAVLCYAMLCRAAMQHAVLCYLCHAISVDTVEI